MTGQLTFPDPTRSRPLEFHLVCRQPEHYHFSNNDGIVYHNITSELAVSAWNHEKCKQMPRKSYLLGNVRRLLEERQAGDIAENEVGLGFYLLHPRVSMPEGMHFFSIRSSGIVCLADSGSGSHRMFSALRSVEPTATDAACDRTRKRARPWKATIAWSMRRLLRGPVALESYGLSSRLRQLETATSSGIANPTELAYQSNYRKNT